MPTQYPSLPSLEGGNLWTTPGNTAPSYSYAGYVGGTQLPLASEVPSTMSHELAAARELPGESTGMGPAGYATAMGVAGVAQVFVNEWQRQSQNAAIDAYRKRVEQEAAASRVSQLEDVRKQRERLDTKARLQSAMVNKEYLMRRAAAAVSAGASGVGGTTAQQVVASEELRQARALAGIEAELRINKQTLAEQERGISIQERQRLLRAQGIRGSSSTVVPDLAMVGLQAYNTYLNLQGAQKQGTAGAIEAMS